MKFFLRYSFRSEKRLQYAIFALVVWGKKSSSSPSGSKERTACVRKNLCTSITTTAPTKMGQGWARYKSRKQRRVLLVGLDAAGKTTLFFRLVAGKTLNTVPTVGFNVKVRCDLTALFSFLISTFPFLSPLCNVRTGADFLFTFFLSLLFLFLFLL